MHIEIITMRACPNDGPKKADVGIKCSFAPGLPGIIIQGLQIFEGSRGLYVTWPSWREGADKDSPRFLICQLESYEDRWAAEISVLASFRDTVLKGNHEVPHAG